MSAVKQIQAVARDRVGKGAARAVRRQGRVPAVIYGGGEPAEPIALDFNQTKQMIFAGHFLTTIFEIDVDGQKTRAIPRDYQLDPVKDFPVHIDFLRLAEGQTHQGDGPGPRRRPGQASPGLKRGGALAGRRARHRASGAGRRHPGLGRGLDRRTRHRRHRPPVGRDPARGREGGRRRTT